MGLGDWMSEISGYNSARKAQEADKRAKQQYAKGQDYQGKFDASTGANAGDYTRLAGEAGARFAGENADKISATQRKQAYSQALGSGMNSAAAARLAAQSAGDIYSQAYGNLLNKGVDTYGQGTGFMSGARDSAMSTSAQQSAQSTADSTTAANQFVNTAGVLGGGFKEIGGKLGGLLKEEPKK